MPKITFLGAGSSVFAKNVLGDCMLTPALSGAEIALYDINAQRLKESQQLLEALNRNINQGRARITAHLGEGQRRAALKGADYLVNAIQVGGYKPSTVIDFEIPKKYGLRQTIGDTLGIGGIFRALRTIPVLLDFARDIQAVCPRAWLLNYSNPMAMLTGALLQGPKIKAVGLCHSVQVCARGLLSRVNMDPARYPKLQWKIAGINHMAWLLEITDGEGRDLYPQIKARAAQLLEVSRKKGATKPDDMVRLAMMLYFGYYITESSEHNAEYTPYWIKRQYPELIAEWNIPLDEYLHRCVSQIEKWKRQQRGILQDLATTHQRSVEYASHILEAMETDVPYRFHGNILNTGLIPNLPAKACVEVPCLVDRNGVQGCHVGDLPEACAALNRTNINVQLLTIEAALTQKRDLIYQAAALDPHTASELSLDDIRRMCDDLIAAHGDMLPEYHAPARVSLADLWGGSIRDFWLLGPFENAVTPGQKHGWERSFPTNSEEEAQVTGLSHSLNQVLPPEKRVDLKAAYTGKGGKRIRWRAVPAAKLTSWDGYVDFLTLLEKVDLAVGYAYTVLKAKRAVSAVLTFGSDDGLAVWLNGREILRREAMRAAKPGQETVKVQLKKGRNPLLIKVDQKLGGWGFYASFQKLPAGVTVQMG